VKLPVFPPPSVYSVFRLKWRLLTRLALTPTTDTHALAGISGPDEGFGLAVVHPSAAVPGSHGVIGGNFLRSDVKCVKSRRASAFLETHTRGAG
jgi:hypothetical protein